MVCGLHRRRWIKEIYEHIISETTPNHFHAGDTPTLIVSNCFIIVLSELLLLSLLPETLTSALLGLEEPPKKVESDIYFHPFFPLLPSFLSSILLTYLPFLSLFLHSPLSPFSFHPFFFLFSLSFLLQHSFSIFPSSHLSFSPPYDDSYDGVPVCNRPPAPVFSCC